jgi:hypothetical protein
MIWGSCSSGSEEFCVLRNTLCRSVKVSWHFRGTYRLHCQGWRVNQARNWHETGSSNTAYSLLDSGFLLDLLLSSEDGADMFVQNIGWLSPGYIMLYPRRYNSSELSLINPFTVMRAQILLWKNTLFNVYCRFYFVIKEI